MHDEEPRDPESLSQQVVEAVASWPHVTKGDGPFGSPALYLGTNQIGHIHLDERPSVDITFPTPLRKQLLAEGRTEAHPVDGGAESPKATLYIIESTNDIADAIWLFRLSYLVHVSLLQKRGKAEAALAELDVRNELDELEPTDAVRDAFEAVVATS